MTISIIDTPQPPMRLLILGATGATGRALVDQALLRRHRVTALVRSPGKLGARAGLTVISGDPLQEETVAAVVLRHDAVLSAIGPRRLGRTTVVRESARAIVGAMKATQVRRLAILSVAVLFSDVGLVGSVLRRTILRGVADDSAAMEQIVRASDLDWTIVRPPRLTPGARTDEYAVANDQLPAGAGGTSSIARADLANFLLDEVERPEHIRRVVGIARAKGKPRHRL